jgi:hypothetical protein
VSHSSSAPPPSVLFVAYHFAPESTSGTHRGLHFARALEDAGYHVHVVTAREPPPSRADPELLTVFPWTERIHRVANGASVSGTYLYLKRLLRRGREPRLASASARLPEGETQPDGGPRGMGGSLRHHLRVWDALPDTRSAWLRPATRLGVAVGRRARVAAVFASGPPWTGMMTGHRVARALGVPFLADFRDPWTQRTGATWGYPTEWARQRVEGWEAQILSDASFVLFNSPRLAAAAGTHARIHGRSCVLLNGSDVPRRQADSVVSPDAPLRFRHLGSLYAGRTVLPLVRALESLMSRGLVGEEDVAVELIGDHELPHGELSALRRSPVSVQFTPHLPFARAAAEMAEPAVLLAVQSAELATLIPTKLFDYLCTGNPLAVLSPDASATWDIARAFTRCHRLDPEPSDRNSLVLARLIEDWRAGGLRAVRSVEDTAHLTKRHIGAEFVALVDGVIRGLRPDCIAADGSTS